MLRFLLVLVLAIICCQSVLADQARVTTRFESSNRKYELRFQGFDAPWKMIATESNSELYTLDEILGPREQLSSMTAVISDDGRNVIVIDDYSRQEFDQNPRVLYFFLNGKKIREYRLADLIKQQFVMRTVSHFRWIFRSKIVPISNSQIALTTFDKWEIAFNIDSGEIVQKKLDVPPGAVFVFGDVAGLGGNVSEIVVECVVAGESKIGDRIRFTSKKFRWDGTRFPEALIIMNGNLVERVGVHFNNCDWSKMSRSN